MRKIKIKNSFKFALFAISTILMSFAVHFFIQKYQYQNMLTNDVISQQSAKSMFELNKKYGGVNMEPLYDKSAKKDFMATVFIKTSMFDRKINENTEKKINLKKKIVENEILVKFNPKKGESEIYRLQAGKDIDTKEMIEDYSKIDEVEFAEENYIIELDSIETNNIKPNQDLIDALISDNNNQLTLQSELSYKIFKSTDGKVRIVSRNSENKNIFPKNLPILNQEKKNGVINTITFFDKNKDMNTIDGDYTIAIQSPENKNKKLSIFIFDNKKWKKLENYGQWYNDFYIFSTDKIGRIQFVEIQGEKEINEKKEVVVAIIDSGLDIKHEIMKGFLYENKKEMDGNLNIDDDKNGFIDDKNGWNFIENNNKLHDDLGHGTHISGIVVSQLKNDRILENGNLKIITAKVFDGRFGTISDVCKGIRYAADNDADIINMSLGGTQKSYALQSAIKYAQKKGAKIVSSAGNKGNSTKFYPAAFDEVLSICAVDNNGNKISSSNFGDWVDICAFGKSIYSSKPGNKWGRLTGTSQSAGFISGLGAKKILINENIKNNYEDFKNAILEESETFPKETKENFSGKLGVGFIGGKLIE